MAFLAPIAKDKLPIATVEQIQGIPGSALTSKDRDEEWDKAFEARVAALPATSELVNLLRAPSLADDRKNDESLQAKFKALRSDAERIGVFGAATRLPASNQESQKPRVKAVFLVIGPAFQEAYKRAKEGNEIRPMTIVERQSADRAVRFTRAR